MDESLTCTSQTTVGRESMSRAGRTRTTASQCVVGLKISSVHRLWMSVWRGDHDGAGACHLGEHVRGEMPP
jgi:hypothetical protein